MLATLFTFVVGFLTALGVVFFLLFQWNPTTTVAAALAARRAKRAASSGPPDRTKWESQQLRHLSAQSLSTAAESATWLNAVAGYVFAQVAAKVAETAADGRLEEAINRKVLAKIKYPHFVSPIMVSELSIGSSLPIIQQVNLVQADPAHPLVFDVSCAYHGSAFICIETGLGLNAPIMNLATLPIELAVKSLQLEFKARVQVDASALPAAHVVITLLASDPTPKFDFELHSHIGSALILSDLSTLQMVFQQVLQEVMEDEIIEPNCVEFTVNLW